MINQSSVERIRKISRAILATVVVFVLTITYFATTAFAGMLGEYSVEIVDGANTTTVTTNETAAFEILNQNSILLGPSDKVDISNFESGKGGTIVINRLKSVNIDFKGNITSYSVYANTVEEALAEIGIALSDGEEINFNATDKVADGMVIKIATPFSVELTADGTTKSYALLEGTVADLLAIAQITLGENDYTEPSAEIQLEVGMQVVVNRVEYKTETKVEQVKYSTKEIKDSSLLQGSKKTVSDGKYGSDRVTYNVKYINGSASEYVETQRTTISEPVEKVVKVGTKPYSKDFESNGVERKGNRYVGEVIKGRKTHYCACKKCNGSSSTGTTASGIKVYNGMTNPYIVACNWLPLGSIIDVDGVQYTVADRGGRGLSPVGRIDVFTPEGHSACIKKGTGSCKITVLRIGW